MEDCFPISDSIQSHHGRARGRPVCRARAYEYIDSIIRIPCDTTVVVLIERIERIDDRESPVRRRAERARRPASDGAGRAHITNWMQLVQTVHRRDAGGARRTDVCVCTAR